jgi:FixJ family two-component response regulator
MVPAGNDSQTVFVVDDDAAIRNARCPLLDAVGKRWGSFRA